MHAGGLGPLDDGSECHPRRVTFPIDASNVRERAEGIDHKEDRMA